MKRSGLVASEDAPAAETEQADVEETESKDDYSAVPSKPSHLDFRKSTISEDDLPKLLKLGYFSEAKKELVRFGGEETTPKPGKDEVVVFKSFFKAGLRFPLNKMIADVLKKFGIYLHQLTPNAIVRLSICWGEGKDATLRSRPSLQSLVRRRQNGQGHPSLDSAPDEGLRRRHPIVRLRPAQRPMCDPAHCNGPCVAAACYGPNL
jgi:hypothetical protein